MAIVAFTAADLANGRYEDDELTTQGTDQYDGALVVVRADGALAIALRAFALRRQGCMVPVRPSQILSRTPAGTNPGPGAADPNDTTTEGNP